VKCQNTIIGNNFIRGIFGRSMHVARDWTPPKEHHLVASCHVGVDGEGFQDKRVREMVHENDLVATTLSLESRTPERSRLERSSTTTLGHVKGLLRSFGGGFFSQERQFSNFNVKTKVICEFCPLKSRVVHM